MQNQVIGTTSSHNLEGKGIVKAFLLFFCLLFTAAHLAA
jgi:hypothetical protein